MIARQIVNSRFVSFLHLFKQVHRLMTFFFKNCDILLFSKICNNCSTSTNRCVSVFLSKMSKMHEKLKCLRWLMISHIFCGDWQTFITHACYAFPVFFNFKRHHHMYMLSWKSSNFCFTLIWLMLSYEIPKKNGYLNQMG